jgi:hypothetical protein
MAETGADIFNNGNHAEIEISKADRNRIWENG